MFEEIDRFLEPEVLGDSIVLEGGFADPALRPWKMRWTASIDDNPGGDSRKQIQ